MGVNLSIAIVAACMLLGAGGGWPVAGNRAEANATDIRIDCNYPGGNIVVERIEGDRVVLRPDLRDTQGWWFYWNFRVRGAAGRTVTFQFSGRNPIGVRGPAVSADGGRTWSWLGQQSVKNGSFTYAFAPDADEVRFAFAVPYLQSNLERFLAKHQGSAHLAVRQLCKSRKGRTVVRLHAGCLQREPKYRIVLTARHHACESMASFELEGLVAAVLADDEPARWYQESVEVLAVPFMDKDGVEEGDQGKNRRPHDHNRDYGPGTIYPEVAAIKRLVPAWSQGKLKVWLDLHCPWIRGGLNERIYQVGLPQPQRWHQQRQFARILESIRQGPLPYRASDDLPFGKGWNTASHYGDQFSSAMWAAQLDGVQLVSTIELPYADVQGVPVTPESARQFGHDLARALHRYLLQF